MLNLQIFTVIIMTKKKKHKKINKNNKKKIVSFPRFEPGTHGFKIHLQIHYAMEANANYDKNNQYMLKL